jgi:hypothetical protein
MERGEDSRSLPREESGTFGGIGARRHSAANHTAIALRPRVA